MLGLIDESTPTGPRGLHYVIASAIVIENAEKCRQRVVEVTGGRARPFHYSAEGVQMRATILECFGELPLFLVTVVHEPVHPKQQTKARAAALRELLPRLEREGVTDLIIESRGIQDRDDHETIGQAQADEIVSAKRVCCTVR